jgi:hypothetical protein
MKKKVTLVRSRIKVVIEQKKGKEVIKVITKNQ